MLLFFLLNSVHLLGASLGGEHAQNSGSAANIEHSLAPADKKIKSIEIQSEQPECSNSASAKMLGRLQKGALCMLAVNSLEEMSVVDDGLRTKSAVKQQNRADGERRRQAQTRRR